MADGGFKYECTECGDGLSKSLIEDANGKQVVTKCPVCGEGTVFVADEDGD